MRNTLRGTSLWWAPAWAAGCWAIRWPGQAAGCCSSRRDARHCPECRGRSALRYRKWPSRSRRRSHQPTPRQSASWPAPIISTARRRRSANTPQPAEIFHKISGGRNSFSGFGHPGADLAGAGQILRRKDGTQIRDQRFLGSGRKTPGGAHLQPFDPSSPERARIAFEAKRSHTCTRLCRSHSLVQGVGR